MSGGIESGKTTLCLKLLEQFRRHGLQVKGVICPPVFEAGIKTGIDILDAATGEQRRLASLRTSAGEGEFTERWQFDANSLAWGNTILKTAAPCDVLFIDELGPLEFERGAGWQNGLSAIDSRNYTTAIAVVRPALLKAARRRWADALVYTVTRENQDLILDQILKIAPHES